MKLQKGWSTFSLMIVCIFSQVGGVEFTSPVPEYLGDSSSGTMGDRAPMQGDITHVYVEPGSEIEKGEPLLALESMKMEVSIIVKSKHSSFELKCWVAYTDLDQRSQTSYTFLCNGVVDHGAPVGGIWFLPTTHVGTNTNKMRPRSSCLVQRFTHMRPVPTKWETSRKISFERYKQICYVQTISFKMIYNMPGLWSSLGSKTH